LWVGGRSTAAFRLAASFADAWNAWMAPPATMRTALERLRARRGESAQVTWGAAVVIGRDDDAAHAALEGRPASRYVVGSPHTIAARLDELRAAGVAHVVLTPAAGATQEAYELIAETRRLLVL
jgi:alkanesulfonate monooxygenase SsuD/methylene tetrahydromethanopterin reductase-like flavin-dependent oxidoreductase (luciferase family)